MYISKNTVRMHDTDAAGILYFGRIYRFAHDALEDLLSEEGLLFHELFNTKDFAFVIVHSEADYKHPLTVGFKLEVHVAVEHIGKSSFTVGYKIFKLPEHSLAGTCKTVHVTVDPKKRVKIDIPKSLKHILEKHK